MQALNYRDVVDQLLASVPEFQDTDYFWDADLPHVVFGCFAIFLCDEGRGGQLRASAIHRATHFMERMARSQDDDVVNLLWVSVLEYLVDEPSCLERLQTLMGPETLALIKRVQAV